MKEARKAFFFEKKKQKTFVPRICGSRASPEPARALTQQVMKVFCFFFAKKKALLP